MTTLAMAAGMLPAAFAVGAGGEFRSPMAIAVIGGLVVSTLLTLVFVPAFFLVMDDFGRLLDAVFGRYVTGKKEPDKPHGPPAPEGPAAPSRRRRLV